MQEEREVALGYTNVINYVLANSKLEKDQFILAMIDTYEFATFMVAKNNKLIVLGEINYDKFLSPRPELNLPSYRVALKRFLDFCIQKLQDDTIQVPKLYGVPNQWDPCYKI